MLTAAQQRAVDGFTKSLVVLGDDALIDAHHQALEDYRRPHRGRRHCRQSLCPESCDRIRDAGSLPGLSKPL